MKILSLYKWIAGSMTDFINQFRNNEVLYSQARAFWNKMEGASSVFLVILLVFGISIALFYYLPYNNQPGRHYTPKHWFLFLVVTFALTFCVTWGFEYFAVRPELDGSTMLQLKIALGNAIYAAILYWVVSVIWCNGLPTNAYRIFKF